TSTPIHRFLSSPNKNLVKFMISPMRVTTQQSAPLTSLASFEQRMVPYILDPHFADPIYLTTSHGRPGFNDCALGLAQADRQAGMQYLREYTNAKLGKCPLVLGLTDLGSVPQEDDGTMCFEMGLDPPHVLNFGTQQSIDYAQMMQHWTYTTPGGATQNTP